MPASKMFNYSYWEIKEYFNQFDLIVVGSGIVGLSTAISFSEEHPKARILVLERGFLPDGASTRNAGFACFGSAGEIMADLRTMDAPSVSDTVRMRWLGLGLLRERLGDNKIGYQADGGYELFYEQNAFDACVNALPQLNAIIEDATGMSNCYEVCKDNFSTLRNHVGIIRNAYEGQLDTGSMMKALLGLARQSGITILNNVTVHGISDLGNRVELQSDKGMFSASQVAIATNGFTGNLLPSEDLKPARAQVLVTSVVQNLNLKGAFHFDEGYYYFREVDGRVLFGGGRNLDITGETSTEHRLNNRIQQQLETYLRERILFGVPFEIEHRWTGIMAVGREKKPIIRPVSANVIAAVRMGGMGIAIGSRVGKEAAALLR